MSKFTYLPFVPIGVFDKHVELHCKPHAPYHVWTLLVGKLKIEMTDTLRDIFVHLNERNIPSDTRTAPVSELNVK
jgi:hypothetical protein